MSYYIHLLCYSTPCCLSNKIISFLNQLLTLESQIFSPISLSLFFLLSLFFTHQTANTVQYTTHTEPQDLYFCLLFSFIVRWLYRCLKTSTRCFCFVLFTFSVLAPRVSKQKLCVLCFTFLASPSLTITATTKLRKHKLGDRTCCDFYSPVHTQQNIIDDLVV